MYGFWSTSNLCLENCIQSSLTYGFMFGASTLWVGQSVKTSAGLGKKARGMNRSGTTAQREPDDYRQLILLFGLRQHPSTTTIRQSIYYYLIWITEQIDFTEKILKLSMFAMLINSFCQGSAESEILAANENNNLYNIAPFLIIYTLLRFF